MKATALKNKTHSLTMEVLDFLWSNLEWCLDVLAVGDMLEHPTAKPKTEDEDFTQIG